MQSNGEWQSFLRESGASLADTVIQDFGNADLERKRTRDADILTDLSQLSLIRIEGEDAGSFLQGQFSNDIQLVTETHSQLSAYSSAQGRMFAIFRVFMSGGGYFLQLPSALVETIVKRLRMFVLRAKVRIEAADAEWVRIGVSGPNVDAILTDAAIALPEQVDGCLAQGDLITLRLPGPWPRFEVLGRIDAMKVLWTRLRSRLTPVGSGAWSWLDIVAGIPTILPATVEAFVPQMANLDILGGINFKKGCYPGQEIVARMHYLGRLKQRMVRASVDVADKPAPGTTIYAPDFVGQSAGTVVDAQPGPEKGFDLLAVVQLSSVKGGELHLATADGPLLRLIELPYSLEQKSESAVG